MRPTASPGEPSGRLASGRRRDRGRGRRATGDGRREVLGFEVGDTESQPFWTESLRSLKARGLAGTQLVTSDAHTGLIAAIGTVMQGAAWQRCRVHFMPNVLTRVPK